MKINLKILLYILLLFMPLTNYISKNISEQLVLVVYVPILILMLYLIMTIGINLKDKITFWFLSFIMYVFIVNLFYMDSIVSILNLPIIMLLLWSSFAAARYITKIKQLTIEKIFLFSIYQLIIILIYIFIDKLNGVDYYVLVYTATTETGGIGGNVAKYASVLAPLVAIFSYYGSLTFSSLNIFAILMTLRRSALISALIFFIIFYIPKMFKLKTLLITIRNTIIVCVTIIIVLKFINVDILNNFIKIFENRLDDLINGTGSGRSIFWGHAMDFYSSYSINEMLFGDPTGLIAYMKLKFGLAIGAHSDIIDFLVNYGVVGLLLYLTIFYNFILYFIRNYSLFNDESRTGISLITSIFFIAIVSGGMFITINIMLFIFLGYLVGVTEIKEDKNEK